MAEFPKAPLKRVLIKAGARRVSEDAVEELRKLTLQRASDLAAKAIAQAKKADRKTVTEEDIVRASRV
jgi:histone H3/H4